MTEKTCRYLERELALKEKFPPYERCSLSQLLVWWNFYKREESYGHVYVGSCIEQQAKIREISREMGFLDDEFDLAYATEYTNFRKNFRNGSINPYKIPWFKRANIPFTPQNITYAAYKTWKEEQRQKKVELNGFSDEVV